MLLLPVSRSTIKVTDNLTCMGVVSDISGQTILVGRHYITAGLHVRVPTNNSLKHSPLIHSQKTNTNQSISHLRKKETNSTKFK